MRSPHLVTDPRCPVAPPEFVAELEARVRSTGRPHVGVRPVTDTVKLYADGRVGDSVDRDTLVQLVSPLVLPAGHIPGTGDLATEVASCADVVFVDAPEPGRPVS